MNAKPLPFEPGRPIHSQLTSNRLNRMEQSIPRIRFSGGGASVSYLGDQVFVRIPKPRILLSQITRPFFTTDQSAGGANGLISITAGTITDLTNSGTVWTGTTGPNIIYMNDPVAGNVPFALELTGPPKRQPYLQLNPAATCCYLNATVDSTTGFITALEIDSDTGSGMPVSTATNWYQLLSSLTVLIADGVASVICANDGAQSSLYFAICGLLPLTDGNSYRVGT